jgi:hypothetical protein
MCEAKVDVAASVAKSTTDKQMIATVPCLVDERVSISRLRVDMTSGRSVRHVAANVPRLPSTKSCQTSSRLQRGEEEGRLGLLLLRPVPFIDRERVSSRCLRVDMSTRRRCESGRSRQEFVDMPRCEMENEGERNRDERGTCLRLGPQRLVNCHAHSHTRDKDNRASCRALPRAAERS